MRVLIRSVFVVALVLCLAAVALASAQDEYVRGVSAFKSLLANEKRAGLRAEWQAVMKPFERSLAAAPKGDYAPKCMYFIGRSLEELSRRSFLKSDRKAALDAFDRMLAAHPKHEWADDSLYRKGMIWSEQAKDSAQAEAIFKALITNYPKADLAPEARKRLAALQGTGKDSAPAVQNAESGKTPGADTAKPLVKDEPKPQPPAASAPAPSVMADTGLTLLGIRHWSSSDYTRVVMDLTHDVKYERALVEKTTNGNKQLQITLQKTGIAADVMPERTIQDGILSQIRVGADSSGGALVTFDLMQMDSYRVFTLPDPYRVVLDIYGAAGGKVVQASTAPAPTPASVPSPAASPSQTPARSAKPASTIAAEEKDHVLAALAELQAKQALESTQKKDAPKKLDAKAAATKNAGAAPAAVAQKAAPEARSEKQIIPEMEVSAKQKKYSGSLVEQLGLKVRTIMIDAGHGGRDPGAVSNGLEEKDINLRMAMIMGRTLQAQGFEVHYTRTTDKFIPLEERTAMANAKNADLFISLHCNAYKDGSAKGLEVYYLNLATDAQAVRVAARENGVSAKKISDMQFILSDLMLNSKINESRQMASLVEQETLRTMRPKHPFSSHGSKGAFFYVLTGARMPSILVELGYLTNPAEAAKLNSDAYLETMAKGLAGGVLAYKKKLERFALNESGKS